MSPRVIRMVVLVVIGIGVGTYAKMARKNDAGKTARATAMDILVKVDGYQANEKFYDMYADLAHQAALDDSYTIGGRRTRDTFDEGQYMNVFFGRLIARARDEGKPDVVRALQGLCDEENIQPVTK